jgi:isopentenyl diphosphate isomerase/L-lactate dehydrogenase-like FMN-dependent dehydrogenase
VDSVFCGEHPQPGAPRLDGELRLGHPRAGWFIMRGTMPSNLDEKFQTLHEIVKAAKQNLAPGPWDYLIGGAESETTLKRNRLAIDSLAFRPRVLRNVSKVDYSSTFLGRPIRIPVMCAPVGSIESFDAGGGATVAKATAEFGAVQMLSSVCNPGLEAVAAAADNFRIFQLYVRGDDAWVDDHVKRAIDNGYTAFCLTVDTASYSRRERDLAKRFVKPWRVRATGHDFQAALNWDHVKRFKDKHRIPLILKGIATAEDAGLACEHGVDVVYVSNHGGRQLDHGRGSLDVLPEVLAEVQKRAAVIVDGSFVRGTDVVKAIALGADLVGIGRLACCGLAAAGQAGLVRVLELLEDEIRIAMRLLGITSWKELDRSYLHAAPPVVPPHATSAFPLLAEGY